MLLRPVLMSGSSRPRPGLTLVHSDSEPDSEDEHHPSSISIRPIPAMCPGHPSAHMSAEQLKMVVMQMFMGSRHSMTSVMPYSGASQPVAAALSSFLANHDPRPSLRHFDIPAAIGGGLTPTQEYLRRVAVPSKPITNPSPLVVLCLDLVVDARLPYHLSGGYTDVIKRPYLDTLMRFLLRPKSPWAIAFYTKLPRAQALKTLRELRLPTGGPEKDERDGVVGLFAQDDMRRGWAGGEIEIKDLDHMWSELYKEEGIHWTQETTVVISDNPAHFVKQPFNLVCVPTYSYKSNVPAQNDQTLLNAVAVLKDLETETNFAFHCKEMGWNNPTFFQDWHNPKGAVARALYTQMAVRICAYERIPIVAYGGNKFD